MSTAGQSVRRIPADDLELRDVELHGHRVAYRCAGSGPAIVRSLPYEGNRIDENQVFVLGLDAPAKPETIVANARCVAAGVNEEIGVRLAVFADAGSLWNYQGPSQLQLQQIFAGQTITPSDNDMHVRASVGAGILWDSPFGPLRLDYAHAFMKQECGPFVTGGPQCDKVQAIRFGGGTKF